MLFRSAVMGQGCYEWICSYLAIVNGDRVVVPIDKELSGAEIGNLFAASECDTVFCTYEECDKLEGIGRIKSLIVMEMYGDRTEADSKPIPAVSESGLERLRRFLPDAEVSLWKESLMAGEELIANGDVSYENIGVDPDKTSVILFTSGTTGNPKVSFAYMRLGLRSCFFCVISARLSFLGRSTKRRIGNAGGNALLPGPGQRALASIVREKAQRAADCTYRRLDGNPRQWVCRTSACLSCILMM